MSEPKKVTVIHHSADFDGLFCREIAKKFFPGAELIGWDYGDPLIPMPQDGIVYILDLSPECLVETKGGEKASFWDRIIWIDHHKSAMEKFSPSIYGYRIDGVAACRLAYAWFTSNQFDPQVHPSDWRLPSKQDFIDRNVTEPYAVRLAGEYDIWDKRDPNADVLQLGLRSRDLSDYDWQMLLSDKVNPSIEGTGMDVTDSELICKGLLDNGRLLQAYQRRGDEMAMRNSFIVEFEGLKFLALNTPGKGSMAFRSLDVPETGHDALFKFNWTGKVWDCSMYHASHRNDIDLSTIAVKHGGGGHRGACGFRVEKLPFLP